MRTVQMTLDDDLVRAVDGAARKLSTTRSAFTRRALRDALTHLDAALLEQRHRRGYLGHPVEPSEFSVREQDRAWGDQ